MNKIYIYDDDSLMNVINEIIDADAESNGNITLHDITDDVECYNWTTDEQEFIDEHIDDCVIYQVTQCVVGAWEQPIDLVAVEY